MNAEIPTNYELTQGVKTEFPCYLHFSQTFLQDKLGFVNMLLSI